MRRRGLEVEREIFDFLRDIEREIRYLWGQGREEFSEENTFFLFVKKN